MGETGSSEPRPVLVLQVEHRCGPWACRSLSRAGFFVIGAVGRGSRAVRSRYCDRLIEVAPPARAPEEFVRDVERACAEHRVVAVLANDAEGVTQMLANQTWEQNGSVFVGPTAVQYQSVCDKANLYATATAAGLSTPASATVTDAGPESAFPPLPSIVKPRVTQTSTGTSLVSRSVVAVATELERDEAIRSMVADTGGAVVEERIVGTAWRTHFVTDGDRTAYVPVQTVRSSPEDAGMSSVQVVPDAVPAGLEAAAATLIRHLGYRGPGSFQFIERDGVLYLHDVNLRFPSSLAMTMLAGLDMPRLAVEVALGQPVEPVVARSHARYVWLEGELRNLRDRRRRGDSLRRRAEILVEIALGLVLPRRVVDEIMPRDPLPSLAALVRFVREARRSGDR
jgi:predicted ATP-grasp superfamily ATP-dependent carboligase